MARGAEKNAFASWFARGFPKMLHDELMDLVNFKLMSYSGTRSKTPEPPLEDAHLVCSRLFFYLEIG